MRYIASWSFGFLICKMEYYCKVYLTVWLLKSNEKIDVMKNCLIKARELEEL